jgi:hypothetical protein
MGVRCYKYYPVKSPVTNMWNVMLETEWYNSERVVRTVVRSGLNLCEAWKLVGKFTNKMKGMRYEI